MCLGARRSTDVCNGAAHTDAPMERIPHAHNHIETANVVVCVNVTQIQRSTNTLTCRAHATVFVCVLPIETDRRGNELLWQMISIRWCRCCCCFSHLHSTQMFTIQIQIEINYSPLSWWRRIAPCEWISIRENYQCGFRLNRISLKFENLSASLSRKFQVNFWRVFWGIIQMKVFLEFCFETILQTPKHDNRNQLANKHQCKVLFHIRTTAGDLCECLFACVLWVVWVTGWRRICVCVRLFKCRKKTTTKRQQQPAPTTLFSVLTSMTSQNSASMLIHVNSHVLRCLAYQCDRLCLVLIWCEWYCSMIAWLSFWTVWSTTTTTLKNWIINRLNALCGFGSGPFRSVFFLGETVDVIGDLRWGISWRRLSPTWRNSLTGYFCSMKNPTRWRRERAMIYCSRLDSTAMMTLSTMTNYSF